ncbi:MAG: tetratricopeptide repeat protein, partial [Nitrospirae bacterium]|nr:tetratricopeptide repeat protein [Nitrospirota bacterium]
LIPVFLTMLIIPLTFIGTDKPIGGLISDIDEDTRFQTKLSRLDYLSTQFRVITTYVRLLFVPINQNLDYDYPVYNSFLNPAVFLSFLFLLSIFGFGVYLFYRSRYTIHDTRFTIHDKNNTLLRRELKGDNVHHASCIMYRFVAFGIFWFFISISVESSIIPIYDVIFEHRIYLPSIGFIISFCTALFYVLQRSNRTTVRQFDSTTRYISSFSFLPKALSLYSSVALIVLLSFATYQRNTVWPDDISLWRDVAGKSPQKGRAHNNLGSAYFQRGIIDEAIKQYKLALNFKPNDTIIHYNLAMAYLRKGLINEAEDHLHVIKALREKTRQKRVK